MPRAYLESLLEVLELHRPVEGAAVPRRFLDEDTGVGIKHGQEIDAAGVIARLFVALIEVIELDLLYLFGGTGAFTELEVGALEGSGGHGVGTRAWADLS